MSDIEVKRARIDEVRRLAEVFALESASQSADGRPWDPPLPSGGVFWIARRDGDPVGYAAGTLRPSGCTIGPIFSLPEHRRTGVGAALLDAINQWAEATGVPVVEISVAAENDGGKRFLEARGYQPRRLMMSLRPNKV